MATTMTTTTTSTTSTTTTPAPPSARDDDLNFPDLPPFPTDVPTAPLLRLSLSKLLSDDSDESACLFSVCKELGFFYLDLRGTDVGETILKDADQLFEVGRELFENGAGETGLAEFDFSKDGSYFGYKGFGTGVIDKAGTRDRNEFYNVSKDDLLSLIPPLPAPAVLTTNRPLLESYALAAHTITTLLLTHLCTHLHLPPTSPCYLPSLHRLTAPSADVIRFVKAPPQPVADRRVALGEHTDFGSLTLLFNHLGGLQILPPGRDAQWVYVRPLPGHAIVNLGDAMVKFTNGLLRSNIHRVVSPPGEQAEATRYSLVYFARAEDEVLLRRLDDGDVIPELAEGAEPEEVISSREWVLRRALGKRVVKGEEGLREGEWDKSLGTEGLSRRSYL